jgi:hypothetical protein
MKKLAICPFIGMFNDPETVAGYPSRRNLCYADPDNTHSPTQEHQAKFCLSTYFTECEIIIKKQQSEK